MSYSVNQIIVFFSFIPPLVNCLIVFGRYRRLEPTLHYLAALVLLTGATEIVSRVLWVQKLSNLFILPLFTLAEFALLALMFRQVLRGTWAYRLIPALLVGFGVYSVYTFVDQLGKVEFNDVQQFVESVLVLIFVLTFFYKTMKEAVAIHLESVPMFWASVGLFIYFCGSIFIFISSNYLLAYSQQLYVEVWVVHAILYMVLHVFYAVALCTNPTK